MPNMTEAYRNAVADHGATLITHIALFNGASEVTGGTYARIAVTWVAAAAGVIRPNANLVFNVPSGQTVDGWRGFTAITAGTNYGGKALTSQAFASDGTYTLLAASSGIAHTSPA